MEREVMVTPPLFTDNIPGTESSSPVTRPKSSTARSQWSDPKGATVLLAVFTIFALIISSTPFMAEVLEDREGPFSSEGVPSDTVREYTSLQVNGRAADDWTMFHKDQSHSGYSTAMAPDVGSVLWETNVGSQVIGSPAVVGDVVYIGAENHFLYSFNKTTGVINWNAYLGSPLYSSPAVVDGKIYIGSTDYNLYCVDASDGAILWKFKAGHNIESSPVVYGSRVFFGSMD